MHDAILDLSSELIGRSKKPEDISDSFLVYLSFELTPE